MAIMLNLVIRMNTDISGASEVYTMNPSLPDPHAVARDLIQIRRRLLSNNVNIVDARFHFTGLPPQSEIIRDLPLPLDGDAPRLGAFATSSPDTNFDMDAIHLRFTSREGLNLPLRACNRHLRYAPDVYISRSAFVPGGFAGLSTLKNVWGGTPERAARGGFTAYDYLAGYMEFLVKNCGSSYVNERASPVPPATVGRPISWVFCGYIQGQVIRVASRRVGRPFGPFRGRQRS